VQSVCAFYLNLHFNLNMNLTVSVFPAKAQV